MQRKNKVPVFSSILFCSILSLSAINTYLVETSGQGEIFKVKTNDLVINNEEDIFMLENNMEDSEKAELIVLDEKIALHPEYVFEDVNETLYLLESTVLRTSPYADGETAQELKQYAAVQITGKNNLTYWKTIIDEKEYYIDSSKLTSDKRFVFTVVEETMYSSGDVAVKDNPYNEANTILTLSLNNKVTLIGKNDEQYWKIRSGDTVGYVDKDLLMSSKKSPLIKEDGIYTVRSQEELELIYAIVMQEAGNNYEGALAVITSAANRCHSSRWKSYGSTIFEQLTAPSQYCYSIDNYWRKYLGGNVPDNVKQAVADGLNGKTNHSYTCFRSTSGGDSSRVNIGGNWYFGN